MYAAFFVMSGNVSFHKFCIHILENVLAIGGLDNKSEVGKFLSYFAKFAVFFGTVNACLLFECLCDLDSVLLVIDVDVCHNIFPFHVVGHDPNFFCFLFCSGCFLSQPCDYIIP